MARRQGEAHGEGEKLILRRIWHLISSSTSLSDGSPVLKLRSCASPFFHGDAQKHRHRGELSRTD
jgi:hypothetical protein